MPFCRWNLKMAFGNTPQVNTVTLALQKDPSSVVFGEFDFRFTGGIAFRSKSDVDALPAYTNLVQSVGVPADSATVYAGGGPASAAEAAAGKGAAGGKGSGATRTRGWGLFALGSAVCAGLLAIVMR
ncbi:uncharacterized protein LOC62_02G003455 [Vanrija pseudolonga]|uniref:Uncharacterized protein n=1 Tax=Vanrija pseudolonga TaxID=143232 RepID=A0AAF0Y8M4_9TREE|nr:hypothetical protein LOC62_02G003455 [Vanrija pseudolonga]